MTPCELSDSCIFFNDKMPDMPDVADYLKDKYCRLHFEKCARFRIYKDFGRENVPTSLFPNEEELVDDIAKELKIKAVKNDK